MRIVLGIGIILIYCIALILWLKLHPKSFIWFFRLEWIKRKNKDMNEKEIITQLQELKENCVTKDTLQDFIQLRDYLIKTKLTGKVKNKKLKEDLLNYSFGIKSVTAPIYKYCAKSIIDGNLSHIKFVQTALTEFEEKQKILDTYSEKPNKEVKNGKHKQ